MEISNTLKPPTKPNSVFAKLLILMIFCLGGMFVAQFLGVIIGQIFGIDMTTGQLLYENPEARVPLLLAQMAYSSCLFILAPYVFLKYIDPNLLTGRIIGEAKFPWVLVPLSAVILFTYFPVSGFLVEFNKGITLPESMASFEQSLQSLEETFKKLTEFIVAFDSPAQFFLGLIVIALVPAIGEEYLFRGVLQTYFGKLFKNHHVAIWFTGFFFSAFHLQFYGLLPRMALGVLFGYLFFWSGRLVFPMIAHFLNNGVTLLLVYLHQVGTIKADIENSESFTLFPALISLVFVITLMVFFKQKASQHNYANFPED